MNFYDHAAEKPISHPIVRKGDDGKHYSYMGAMKKHNFEPEYRHHDGTKAHVKIGSFGTAIHAKDYDHQMSLEKLTGYDNNDKKKKPVSENTSAITFKFELLSSSGESILEQSITCNRMGMMLDHIAKTVISYPDNPVIKMRDVVHNSRRLTEAKLESLSTLVTLTTEQYRLDRASFIVKTKNPLIENLKKILIDPKKISKLVTRAKESNKVKEALQEIKLPDLEIGDTLLVGKFKNRKAEIKGFETDEQGQPVAKTTKGDQKVFKSRIAKLMPGAKPVDSTAGPVTEELHPELQNIVTSQNFKRPKQNLIAHKIKYLTNRGEKTGIEGNMPKGSARAYLKHDVPHNIQLDGKPAHIHTGTKVAIRAKLDKHHNHQDYDGMRLGAMQNHAEGGDHSVNNRYRILTRDDDGAYKSNKEAGIFPPLLDHDHDHHEWSHVGHARNIRPNEFQHLTKTKSHPKGISHRAFVDALFRHHNIENGHHWPTNAKKDKHLDHVDEHPLVQKFRDYHSNTGNPPHDLGQKKNMGVFEHPDGSSHIVARDHGFNTDVQSAYRTSREKASAARRAVETKKFELELERERSRKRVLQGDLKGPR